MDFETFYEKAYYLALSAKQKEVTTKQALIYARKVFSKLDLNSFYIIGVLTREQADLLCSKSIKIKFSVDNLLKNILEHPEFDIKDYKNISEYINSADYILKKNNKNLIYFKINNQIYQIVVKCTQDYNELFITTFHIASRKQLNKDIIRYENIKKDSSDYEDSNYPSVT